MPTWTVEGADKNTGQEVVVSIEAATEKDASETASRRGVLVSVVERLAIPDPSALLDDLESVAGPNERRQKIAEYQSPSSQYAVLREIADNTRSIRGWTIFMGILVILAIISRILEALAALVRSSR